MLSADEVWLMIVDNVEFMEGKTVVVASEVSDGSAVVME